LIEDIRAHIFQEEERLLLDTNIWLFTYGPISYRRQNGADVYNQALANISINKCKVYICSIIISEFINRCIDEELRLLGISKSDRKAFRKLPVFRPIAEKIILYVEDIMSFARSCDFKFDSLKVQAFLNEFKNGSLDYNDIIIEDVCKTNSLILVTNDADFKNSPVPLLTANRRMYLEE